ncbi:hypothetical protein AB1Y20_014511 [Prymnesium parvum]|uniref:TLC domain-containing protein n=1 Tax=Prymnesium parvum TaxID=97485 RepID=A0AB34IDM1_PRYPA
MAPELSAATLERHRYRHTLWNLSALAVINGCNFLWLHRTVFRGVNYWSDLLCDVAMAAYQLCETAVDIRWPHVTSSLRAAVTHHLVTVSGILYLRLLAQNVAQRPFLIDCVKHEVVLFGECQNIPRMAMRIMRRGTPWYTATSHFSDALLILRLLYWPIIPIRNSYIMWLAGDTLVISLSVPLFIGHYIVYAQQWRLFRKDVQRIAASLRAALFGAQPRKEE